MIIKSKNIIFNNMLVILDSYSFLFSFVAVIPVPRKDNKDWDQGAATNRKWKRRIRNPGPSSPTLDIKDFWISMWHIILWFLKKFVHKIICHKKSKKLISNSWWGPGNKRPLKSRKWKLRKTVTPIKLEKYNLA